MTDLDSRLAEPNIRVTDDEHIGHGGKEPGHRRGPGAVRDPRQMAALRGFGLEHTPVEPIVKKSGELLPFILSIFYITKYHYSRAPS